MRSPGSGHSGLCSAILPFVLFKSCGSIAFNFRLSASWLRKDFAAHVTFDDVCGVAVEQLLVTAFGAYNAYESASWFGDKVVPFSHCFASV
jgi:hypothetical protein